MYIWMNSIEIKPAAIMISVCSLIGVVIQYFLGFYWLTATLIIMVALLVNGLAIFNEDLEPSGLDYEEGVTDTKEAKSAQRKANNIQSIIITLLIVAAVCSQI